jgi:tetratricopeptide (TPR) repeat protein
VFQQLGGIEGAVAARAEQVVAALAPAQRDALPHVLSLLVDVTEEHGAVTARRAAWSSLNSLDAQALVRALVDARLFVSELASDVASFGVAHEALLRRWPRVAGWIEQHRHALQVRTRIGHDAERWLAAGRPRDLLLPRGSQVNQASALLGLEGFTLAPLQEEYVRSSLQRVKLGERLRLMVMLLITALAVLAVILGLAARSAERDAEQQRTDAEGLMSYMLGEFVEKLRPLGRLDLLDDISGRALAYLSAAQNADASATTLAQRAKALHVIAEVNIARGKEAKATQALQAARTILVRQDHGDTTTKTVLKELGVNAYWQANIYLMRQQLNQAELQFIEYQHYADRLAAADPSDVDGWIEQSYAYVGLGSIAMKGHRYERAAGAFEKSVQLKQRALTLQPGNKKLTAEMANSVSWLAEAKVKVGSLQDAMDLFNRAEQLLRPLHVAAPSDALSTFRLGSSLSFQGELKIAMGQGGDAYTMLVNSESLLHEAVKQEPSNLYWQQSLYAVQIKLLDLDSDVGNAASALPKQLALQQKLAVLGASSSQAQAVSVLVAYAQQSLAATQLKLGLQAEARRQLADSVQRLEQLYQNGKPDAKLYARLAGVLLMQADLDRATGQAAAARSGCLRAQHVLAGVSDDSWDYEVLAPHVRAHLCTGDLPGAAVQQARLERMAYQEAHYRKALATLPGAKGGP